MKKLLLLSVLVLGLLSSFATNDLVITSITRSSDCTTLKWLSNTGEWYTVQWTDQLVPPVFWRVAAANVPSGGTNTTWREGCCAGESMMMSLVTSGGWSSLSAKEQEEKMESAQARAEEGIKFLTAKLQEAANSGAVKSSGSKSGGGMSLLSSPSPSGGGGTNTNGGATVTTARFFRVAKIASGFVDGWGAMFGASRPAITNVIAVAASPRFAGVHGMALRADGTVTNWGANSFGQCNVPTNLTDVMAITAGGRHSVALKQDRTVVSWGDNSLGQVTNAPANLTNVVAVSAGLWHTLALRDDGTVAAWGDLFNRSNAVPVGLSGVTAISAGPRHCLALKCDGTVVAWGFTYTNLLDNFLPTNVPTTLSNVIAISAGMEHSQALLADGTVCVWGNTNNPGVAGALSLTNVIALSAGWHYGTALFADTTVQGWGQGDTEITMDSIVALSAGADHVLVVRTNDEAPVIRGHPRSVFPPLGSTTNFSVTADSALALTYQWQRQMATGWSNLAGATNTTLAFTNVPDSASGIYRAQVSTPLRSVHSRTALLEVLHAPMIASQSPGLVLRRPQFSIELLSVQVTNQGARFLHYEWFKNGEPVALAMGSSFNLYFNRTNDEGAYQVVVRNSAGSATSLLWQASVTLRGEAAVWGDDSYGQLSGRSRQETNLVAVSAGGHHTLGLRENGTVFAWGDNFAGQTDVPPGLANITALAGGAAHSLALLENGTVRAWGNNIHGQTNIPGGLSNVTAIAAGGPQSVALQNNGTLVAWGNTVIPADVSNIMAVAAGATHALALLSNGTVQVWGTTPPSGLSNLVAVAAGHSHALALKKDGTVVGWGGNTYGEATPPPGLSNVMKIAAGYQFSLALRNDGTVVSWGRNDLGQTSVPTGMGEIRDVSAGISHSVALAYSDALEYPVNVAQDLLLIYNATSADSIFVKDYYLQHRPMVSQANVLGLACTNHESINRLQFTNTILNPIQQWLHNNPTKRPRYWLLFFDIPTRINETVFYDQTNSVSYELSIDPVTRSPFITYINAGDTNDCRAYIDKLEFFGTNYSPGKVVISASRGGYGNTNYYLDDAMRATPLGGSGRAGLLAADVPTNNIFYAQRTDPHVSLGTNVGGYFTWAANAGQNRNFSTNGDVVFSGDSRWYVMTTGESYNGQESTAAGQSRFIDWFSSHAFGGTDYEFTPVGATTQVDEPREVGLTDTYAYFNHWASGRRFGKCAWSARRTPYFQAVGDPLVTR